MSSLCSLHGIAAPQCPDVGTGSFGRPAVAAATQASQWHVRFILRQLTRLRGRAPISGLSQLETWEPSYGGRVKHRKTDIPDHTCMVRTNSVA
jgi:hypothetical protein